MGAKFPQRAIVAALVLVTAGAALAAHLVSTSRLDSRSSARVTTARAAIKSALDGRTYFLQDVADMVGVHNDADVSEFSRYAHVRNDEAPDGAAVAAVQWVRRSPSGRLAPAGDVPPGTEIRQPILISPRTRADDALADAAARRRAGSAIRTASLRKRVAMSAPLKLANGDAGFYLAVPVVARRFSGDVSRLESRSAIVGLIDAQKLVSEAVAGQDGVPLELREGPVPLARLGTPPHDVVSRSVPVPGRRWVVSAEAASLTTLETLLPWAIIAFGLGLVFTVHRVLRNTAERRDEAMRTAQLAHEELESARMAAERRSRQDPLTGIFNRRHLNEVLADALKAPNGSPPAFMLLDVDHFKRINDEHGHLMGDVILQATAERIASVVRDSDCLARWGGEEFAILAHGLDRDGVAAFAERTRRALADDPVKVDGREFSLTLSVGAALAVDELRSPQALVDAADQALYEAKDAGRNRVQLRDPDGPVKTLVS